MRHVGYLQDGEAADIKRVRALGHVRRQVRHQQMSHGQCVVVVPVDVRPRCVGGWRRAACACGLRSCTAFYVCLIGLPCMSVSYVCLCVRAALVRGLIHVCAGRPRGRVAMQAQNL